MEEETTYEFPAINEVCDECDGEGFVLCEGMRGYAYSQEEFNEAFDDDDQICPVCNGKNVVPVVAENLLTDKEKVLYAEYQKCEERIAREEAAAPRNFSCRKWVYGMNEFDLKQQLLKTEQELEDARKQIASVKRSMLNAETLVIEKYLAVECLRASIQELQDTTSTNEKSLEDIEIENFRKNNQETMEFIANREKKRLE
jgi:hypothetical protein